MSISNHRGASAGAAATDFDAWLDATFAQEGPFTALVILVQIGEASVDPIASTFMNFIGDEIRWPQIVSVFAGSGKSGAGAAFFAVSEAGGPLLNPEARARLRALEADVRADRLTLNTGAFFDSWGRRMQVEEVSRN